MIPRGFRPAFVGFASVLVVGTGCAPANDHPRTDGLTITADVPTVPASAPVPDPQQMQRAEALADKVEVKAKGTEKAEGKQNLVKDHVAVKTDAQGRPVVEQVGEASWYGQWHQGKKTASGTRFDQGKMTAAHPTLPLGTHAQVTNLDNGKSVDVIINDRGPYVRGRDIDLSKAAAQRIGVDGAARVKIDAVITPAPATSPEG